MPSNGTHPVRYLSYRTVPEGDWWRWSGCCPSGTGTPALSGAARPLNHRPTRTRTQQPPLSPGGAAAYAGCAYVGGAAPSRPMVDEIERCRVAKAPQSRAERQTAAQGAAQHAATVVTVQPHLRRGCGGCASQQGCTCCTANFALNGSQNSTHSYNTMFCCCKCAVHRPPTVGSLTRSLYAHQQRQRILQPGGASSPLLPPLRPRHPFPQRHAQPVGDRRDRHPP